MLIRHQIPPPEKRVGGLDTAIQGLHHALLSQGIDSELVETGREVGCARLADVVHFHGLWNVSQCWQSLSRKYHKEKVVISPHGMLEPWAFKLHRWKKWPFFHLIEKQRLLKAASVLTTSTMEEMHLRALLPKARLHLLPLGLQVPDECSDPEFRRTARRKLGLSAETRMTLFLSRIDPKKGIDMLLTEWLSLRELHRFKDTILFIVGSGHDTTFEASCRAKAESCTKAGAMVKWVGPVWGDARWEYFAAADLFCLPSHSENFGFVVPEAWVCGTPVLTTTGTPWCELGEGPSLFLCEAEPNSLRKGLSASLSADGPDDEMRKSIAQRAYSQYSWDAIIPSYLKFYNSLAGL